MLDLATVVQELESQVRQDRPDQTSLLSMRMRRCPIGRCPLDLERARLCPRSELDWRTDAGDLEQCEVLFAGSFSIRATRCPVASAFRAGLHWQGFLETGEELTFRASGRELQGLKAKLQDLA